MRSSSAQYCTTRSQDGATLDRLWTHAFITSWSDAGGEIWRHGSVSQSPAKPMPVKTVLAELFAAGRGAPFFNHGGAEGAMPHLWQLREGIVSEARSEGAKHMDRSDWTALIAAICRLGGADHGDEPAKDARVVREPQQRMFWDPEGRWEQWLNAFQRLEALAKTAISPQGADHGSAICARLITQGLTAVSFKGDSLVTSDSPLGLSGSPEQGWFFALALSPREAILSTPKALDATRLAAANPQTCARFINLMTVGRASRIYTHGAACSAALRRVLGWGRADGVRFIDVWCDRSDSIGGTDVERR